jgi:hypothetical protein
MTGIIFDAATKARREGLSLGAAQFSWPVAVA